MVKTPAWHCSGLLRKEASLVYLLAMMREDGLKSRSYGIPKPLLIAQSGSLDIPIVLKAASWDNYEEVFIGVLQELRKKGATAGIFGDIDINAHRQWVQKVRARAHITPVHPLWKQDRVRLLNSFMTLGYEATIIVLNAQKMNQKFLGRSINLETVEQLERSAADASGEEEGYHTFVTHGLLFSKAISFKGVEEINHKGYWFLEIEASS